MENSNSDFKVVRLYCCNCGQLLSGCTNKEGLVKYRCPKCGCVLISKKLSRRKSVVEITNIN